MQNHTPTYDKDQFENTALTINGRIGDLKLVYTGGYLVRNIEQQGDYTNYARGVYADYYQCISAVESGKPKGQCYSPVSYWRDRERNTHDSQEFRLSTPDDWRVRGLLRRLLGGIPDQREHRLVLQDPRARPPSPPIASSTSVRRTPPAIP